jgi:hypothetical protein
LLNRKFHLAAHGTYNRCILVCMSKKAIFLLATVFGFIGAYIPVLLGVDDGFGGWSILGGMIGGLFGIWLAVWLSKRF